MTKKRKISGFFRRKGIRIFLWVVGFLLLIILSTAGYIYFNYISPIQSGNTEKMLKLAKRFDDTFENQDIISWNMDLILIPEEGQLEAHNTLVINRKNTKTRRLYFFLNPGLKVESLEINGNEGKARRFMPIVFVKIPKQITEKVLHLNLNYKGHIKPVFGQWYPGEITPKQAILWDASLWYPQETFLFDDRFSSIVTLETPDNFTVVTPGEVISESCSHGVKTTKWKLGDGEGRFPILAGLFEKWETEVQNKKLGVYASQDSHADGATVLDFAEKGLQYYLDWLGDPGREGFSFFIPATRQMYSMYGGGGIFFLVGHFEELIPSFSLLINHELAHNWIPGVMDVDWLNGHDWIGEGFCEYATLKVAEKNLSPESYLDTKWAYEAFRPGFQKPLSKTIGLFGGPLDAEMSYQKGAFVYLMMEQIVGKKNFQKSLSSIIDRYRGKAIPPQTFLSDLNKHCGHDLEPFYKDWVYGTGNIDFAVEKVTSEIHDHSNRVKVILRNQGEIDCPYPIKIACFSSENLDIKNQIIQKTETPMYFEAKGALQKIIIDPELNWADMNRSNNIYPLSQEIVAAVPSKKSRFTAVVKKDYSHYASRFHRWNFDQLFQPSILEIHDKNGKQVFRKQLKGILFARNYSMPQWDQDGQKLLFRYWDYSNQTSQMMLYDTGSHHVEELGEGYTPQWGPDGQTVIFGTNQDLKQINLRTGELEIIQENMGENIHPKVSPSGDKVMFISKNQVILVDTKTGNRQTVFSGKNLKNIGDWSPDGKMIYFVTGQENEHEIIKYDISSGGVESLMFSPFPIEWIQISQNGESLMYVSHEHEAAEYLINILHLMNNRQEVIANISHINGVFPIWIDNDSFCYPSVELFSPYLCTFYNSYYVNKKNIRNKKEKVLF